MKVLAFASNCTHSPHNFVLNFLIHFSFGYRTSLTKYWNYIVGLYQLNQKTETKPKTETTESEKTETKNVPNIRFSLPNQIDQFGTVLVLNIIYCRFTKLNRTCYVYTILSVYRTELNIFMYKCARHGSVKPKNYNRTKTRDNRIQNIRELSKNRIHIKGGLTFWFYPVPNQTKL